MWEKCQYSRLFYLSSDWSRLDHQTPAAVRERGGTTTHERAADIEPMTGHTRQDIVQAPSTVHRWNLNTQRSAVILVLFEENSGRKIIIAMLSFSKRSAFSKCFRQVWKASSKSSVFVTDQFVDDRPKFKFFRCGVGQGPQMNLL